MFDIGFSELVLFAIVALVVLGPEKLPHAAKVAGAWVARLRQTVASVQADIEREIALADTKAQFEKDQQALDRALAEAAHSAKDIEKDIADAVNDAESDAVSAKMITEPAATSPSATSPASGEAAYREWLMTQKRNSTSASEQGDTQIDSPPVTTPQATTPTSPQTER